jgi:hypothetical protein
MEKATMELFTKLNIDLSTNTLDNMTIERDLLLSKPIYNSISDEIDKIRKIIGSSYFTSMQKTAEKSQKWPLLNLVRQILKVQGFKMDPIRKACGYKNGVKQYRRYFSIVRSDKLKI